MPNRMPPALLLAAALTATACSASMKKPDIKNNPHPTQRYELTVTVKDAPGSFDKVDASAMFQVRNPDCVPHDSFTGAADVPGKGERIVLTRVDEHTWKGNFYVDQLQDEDYFGLGVCHWEMMSAGPDFYAHGISFDPSVVTWNESKEQSVTRFFQKRDYFDESLNASNFGSADSWRGTDDKVLKQPEAYFSITVSSRKV